MRKFSEYSSAGALSVWVKPSLHKRAQPRSSVVLGDFGCDVTCQACQTSSGLSDSVNWPGYEAVKGPFYWPIGTHNVVSRDFILHFFVLRSFGGGPGAWMSNFCQS